jgi:SAM-dependent methyltransferase
MPFSIYSVYGKLQPLFRERRRRQFRELFSITDQTTLLDVGGYDYDWKGFATEAQITILNLGRPSPHRCGGKFHYVQADARRLPFPDGAFDIVYSNSVIEHLQTFANQQRFAAELRRVGRELYIQTPNRWFPIEPHFIAPCVHFLPKWMQMPLLSWLSIRGWLRAGDNVSLDELFAELRLLDYNAMRELFPDCRLVCEKLAGLTKSLIAIRTTAAR